MARAKKNKSISLSRLINPQRQAALQRAAINLAIVAAIVGACALAFKSMHRYVDRTLAFYDRAPKIVMKDRPAWMSDFLAEQIVESAQPLGAHSTYDHQLLVDVSDMLAQNPWVKKVRQVRRAYAHSPGDTIEIDCDYRVPLALVHWQDYFWLVDGEGVKLPEQFTAQQVPKVIYGPDGKLQFRIIEGVRQPPVESGHKWAGDDLAAGLKLARYLVDQNFASEIVRVDVSNFAGRIDPKEAQLVLLTKRGSEIRWGRPVDAKDFFVEVSVEQKLDYMRRVYEQFGRVDANQPWIDIRFDKITYPSTSSQARIDPAH